MGQTTRRLIAAAPLLVPALMCVYLFGSGLFDTVEVMFLLASSVCAFLCIARHLGQRQPENVVIVAAGVVFFTAYIAQAILFLVSTRTAATSLGEAISVHSVFSMEALSADKKDIFRSLQVVLVGFVAIALASLCFSGRSRKTAVTQPLRPHMTIISNPMTIGYAAIACTIFFGFLRKIFGLESPAAPALPMGLGGLINIASSYVGPNLAMAACFFAVHQHDDKKTKRLAAITLGLAAYNYVLFTSKLSLVLPVLFLLATQYLLRRTILSTRTLVLMGGAFVVIYPFLNLYRAALALGVGPGELIGYIGKLYASQQDSSEVDRSVVQIALSAILGRVVGYDPLLILLQAKPYPDSLLGYILTGNLDQYLTYEILDFQDPMGYSPGFLGRIFYVSQSFSFVLIVTAGTALLIANLTRKFWRGDIRLKFMAPLLLAYCLVFFSDGIRFELFRSLVISTVIIYSFLWIAAKVRIVPAPEAE